MKFGIELPVGFEQKDKVLGIAQLVVECKKFQALSPIIFRIGPIIITYWFNYIPCTLAHELVIENFWVHRFKTHFSFGIRSVTIAI